ncbi:hypothetical protein EJ06DRAFT_494686 [Trichodelitschia bisporula]|uniref:rhomboid protease n=1 Tax=Trichodelitschia bisporula TaxID=703511 RepID=A0A6G1HVN9_9PEZI|nr:hypothetical protein EJ06DRAFT_494686 [Trichodelitschia bisporula]
MPSAASIPQFNPARLRSYLFRLPLCTRIFLAIIVAFWFASISGGFQHWTTLTPEEVFAGGAYRLNTYPFLHRGIIHAVINIIALTPLLERFESEHGTLVTLVLFTGPFSTIPGVLYVLTNLFVLHTNTSACGASIWTFLLFSAQCVIQSRTTPYLPLPIPSPYRIPTATLPLITMLLTWLFVPYTSLLGHICGSAVGYLWGLGYIRFLAPPEKVLRWIETKFNPLARIPHYVSVDQKVFGRYGVLPSVANGVPLSTLEAGGRRAGSGTV